MKDPIAEKELLVRVAAVEVLRTTVQQRIMTILEAASNNVEHVPFSSYEYDIEVKGMDAGSS